MARYLLGHIILRPEAKRFQNGPIPPLDINAIEVYRGNGTTASIIPVPYIKGHNGGLMRVETFLLDLFLHVIHSDVLIVLYEDERVPDEPAE